ncbi:hypothetical protein SPFL3102_00393 [Sporomusaceae bacterium FL31]|nr:hypothetical protein SPFL3101_01885 [Sporomusaceae bacterium FL31]GCE32604.1 hypothetical protein SPFL3102_00393 [Sporomusaceae bacterium]
MIEVKILPAYHGDSILIHEKTEKYATNILIDGGIVANYKTLKQQVMNIATNKEYIDLLVLTHIDEDHILGLIQLIKDKDIDKKIIKEVWFNSGSIISDHFQKGLSPEREILVTPTNGAQVSFKQAETLEQLLRSHNIWEQKIIRFSKEPHQFDNFSITVLSPDEQSLSDLHTNWPVRTKKTGQVSGHATDYNYSIKELLERKTIPRDPSICNSSSIAFILNIGSKRLLLLGDAIPLKIEESLRNLGYSKDNKLYVDLFKVSHHASKNNTSFELLELIDCKKYIISTNGSNHGLPNKECLAKIVANQKDTELFFNYPLNNIFTAAEKIEYSFSCKYLHELKYTINMEG